MKSAVDNSQDNVRLLSCVDLEELAEVVSDIVVRITSPQAVALLMWDSDLESFGETFVFGAGKKDFKKFVEAYAEDYDGSKVYLGEVETDEIDAKLPDSLQRVICYQVKNDENFCANILVAGSEELEEGELAEQLDQFPFFSALSHAWEYQELKRENDRLRGQYEELEDRIRSMEEQTMKLIHDVMAKNSLRTKMVERELLVYGISNTVRSSVKIQEVLQNVVNQIGSSFGVTHCLLLRPVEADGGLVAFEWHNPYQQSIKELFSTESGHQFMHAAMSREAPHSLEDPLIQDDSGYDREFLTKLGLLSGLIAPLILREHVLGVILLQESSSAREWSIDDNALLGSLADQLSVAIENADLHEERERQAVTDGLTGVANRRHFNDMFTREFERAKRYEQPLSLIVADLDYLKKINDTYGHQAGDEAIKAIARVMKQSSRSIDLAARYGGEEFCLLLPNTDLEMASQIAERLRKLIHDVEIEGPGAISASIGVASFPQHASESEELFLKADEALYSAKQAGRNRVCISGSPQ